MLARVFEEAGLSTVAIAMIREHAARVKPPRALFVPFPFGHALGRPKDPDLQHRVIAAALGLLESQSAPVLADFPDTGDGSVRLVQAGDLAETHAGGSAADEVTALRQFYERWVEEQGGRSLVGLSGIPQRQFRGMVRFLEAFAVGDDADHAGRSEGMPLLQFLRYCVDDLKTFCYEARMSQIPEASEDELHRWFWGGTAAGALVVRVAERMRSSDDPSLKSAAQGLAR